MSCRQRVILMAWRAPGKSRPLTWAVLRVRVSMRPCPVSRVRLPAGTCRRRGEGLGVLERVAQEEMDRIDLEDAHAALAEAEEKGTISLRDLMRVLGD